VKFSLPVTVGWEALPYVEGLAILKRELVANVIELDLKPGHPSGTV